MEGFQNEITQLRQQIAAQQDIINQQQAHIAQQESADAGAPGANQHVIDQLQRLVSSMVLSQVLSNIVSFKGDTKDYRRWIKDIERHVTATGGNDDTKIAIAIQSSAGIVSEFLHRYRVDHPGANWQEIKIELVTRFSDVVDQAHAMSKLRHLKQAPNESVTLFAERLLDGAIDAFPEQGLEQPMIARQLVDIYIDGLREAFIARKIMRDNLGTTTASRTNSGHSRLSESVTHTSEHLQIRVGVYMPISRPV